jgi:hypothetical protein
MNPPTTISVARLRDLSTGQEGELIESTYQSVAGVEDVRFVLRLPGGKIIDRRAHEVAWIRATVPQASASRTLQEQRKAGCDLPRMASFFWTPNSKPQGRSSG